MSVPAVVLCPALDQVMESMYFCVTSYLGTARLEGELLGASVAFSGSVNGSPVPGSVRGEYRLVVSQSRAVRMTADFLPLDPAEVTPSQMEAVIREFANVTCGAALSAWMPAADFHFGIPRDLDAQSLARPFEHCFSVMLPDGSEGERTPELAVEIRIEAAA